MTVSDTFSDVFSFFLFAPNATPRGRRTDSHGGNHAVEVTLPRLGFLTHPYYYYCNRQLSVSKWCVPVQKPHLVTLTEVAARGA